MKYCSLLFFFSLLLVSCNEKAPDEQNSNESIIGSWKLVDWYDVTPRDINNDGEASTDLFSQWNGCKKQSILILSDDGAGKIVYTGEDNNPKCPPDFEAGNFFTTDDWEVDDSNQRFTLVGDDYFDVYEIVQLTPELLVLKKSGFFTCCDAEISYFTGGYLQFERQ